MLSNRYRIFCALSAILMAMAACSLPSAAPAATATPEGLSVVSLEATQTALAAAPTSIPASATLRPPTETTAPTIAAATLTATLPVGVFPSETPTPTLELITAEVMKETNCRSGPAGNFDLVTTFQTGAKLEVMARDLGGGFVFVKNPDKPDEGCYVLVNNIRISGDVAPLPQFTAPASPTAAPNFKVAFKKFDTCKGNVFALFTIENTGSVPFRSAYVRVSDLKSAQVAEQALNAFDLWTGCIIAKNIAPLNPGANGYLTSPQFKKDPRANTLRATFQVCTEQNLKGFCVTTTITIKP